MEYVKHRFQIVVKHTSVLACVGCGLVPLKNSLTAWAIKQGCNYDEHPQLKRITKELGR